MWLFASPSFRPSVHQSAWKNRLPLEGFPCNFIFLSFFFESSRGIKIFTKIWPEQQVCCMTTLTCLWQHVAELFYNKKRFRQKLQRKSKHTFNVQQPFFQNRTVYEVKSKNVKVRETTNDNKAHARCMMDKKGYTRLCTCTHPSDGPPIQPHSHTHTHTHKHTQIRNIYCFSTATMFSHKRLIFTLCVHYIYTKYVLKY